VRAGRAFVAALALFGCAQYGAPPGGERDQLPPQVIATEPAPLSVVPDLRGTVVIRFDERLSERGAERAVVVSPRTGEVRVGRSGSELRIEMEGGWRPGQIYRIVILPELRDLFGNQRREPAELVFSTGPAIPETALAGIVTERISGRPPQRAVVEAVRQADSTVYVTPVATDGFYALLNLPNGEYELTAYVDGNQDWEPGPTEPRSHAQRITLADDTLSRDLAVLPFDTTAARVLSATMQNEVVRVQLDDYVDSTGIAGATATLYSVQDTTPLSFRFSLRVTAPPAPRPEGGVIDADSAADAAAPDSLAAREAAPLEPDAQRGGAQATAASLPTRELFAVPSSRPAPGEYLIAVRGITNINGYPDGSGIVPLTVPAPDTTRAPALVPADSIRPDSIAPPVRADTVVPPRAQRGLELSSVVPPRERRGSEVSSVMPPHEQRGLEVAAARIPQKHGMRRARAGSTP